MTVRRRQGAAAWYAQRPKSSWTKKTKGTTAVRSLRRPALAWLNTARLPLHGQPVCKVLKCPRPVKGRGLVRCAIALGRSLNSVYVRRGILGLPKARKTHRVEKPWKIQ